MVLRIPFHALSTVTAKIAANKSIVFATGVFDLLHPGHVRFLAKARAAGDFLLVGVESDAKATAVKGPGRPIFNQEERMILVSAFASVDAVTPLPRLADNRQYEEICRATHAKKLAVTAEDPFLEIKQSMMTSCGGVVVVVTPRIKPHASSKIINIIQGTHATA